MSSYGKILKPPMHSRGIRRDHPLAPGRLYLPMWEGGGNRVQDLSGRGNNGTLYGSSIVSWKPTTLGPALHWDNANPAGGVTFGNNEDFKIGNTFTMAGWFYADSYPNSYPGMISRRTTFVDGAWNLSMLASGPTLSFMHRVGAFSRSAPSTLPCTSGGWEFYAVRRNGTGQPIQFTVNGTHESIAHSYNLTDGGTHEALVGDLQSGLKYSWDGDIASVEIHNRYLSDAEIEERYHDRWGLDRQPSTRTVLWVAATSGAGAPAGPPKFLPEDIGLKSVNVLSGAA